MGTLRKIVSPQEVLVVWDHNGMRANYRCKSTNSPSTSSSRSSSNSSSGSYSGGGGEFDLRILETSPCGIVHEFVSCDECGQTPLRGIRWICANCSLDKNQVKNA